MEEGKVQDQGKYRRTQFQPGVSGNPAGRPKGSISMKTYVKNKLLEMTEEEREEFLEGVDKKIIWEMGEGKAKQETEHSGSLSISQVLDNLEDDRPETPKQELEGK